MSVAFGARVPSILGLLVVAPLMLTFASLAAVLLLGGVLGAAVLPIVWRRRPRVEQARDDLIELAPGQYTRVDSPPRH